MQLLATKVIDLTDADAVLTITPPTGGTIIVQNIVFTNIERTGDGSVEADINVPGSNVTTDPAWIAGFTNVYQPNEGAPEYTGVADEVVTAISIGTPSDDSLFTVTVQVYGLIVTAEDEVTDPDQYTSINKLQDYLLITIDADFQASVIRWIKSITRHIQNETGRDFIADTEASDRVFDGKGDNTLFIDDAVEVISVKINDTEVDATNLVSYPANDTPKIKLQLKAGRFPVGKQNITVNAKWGYSVTLPEDIEFAATVLVAGIINTSNGGQGDVQSETIGRYSVTYKSTKELTDFEEAKEIIQGYNRIRL